MTLIKRTYMFSSSNIEDFEEFVNLYAKDAESYYITATMNVYHQPSSLLPPLTPAELNEQQTSNMDTSVYDAMLKCPATRMDKTIRQNVLNLYSEVSSSRQVMNRLRYMLQNNTITDSVIRSIVLKDMDDFLNAHPECISGYYQQTNHPILPDTCVPTSSTQASSTPVPPPKIPTVPLVPLRIPTTVASNEPTPIQKAPSTSSQHQPKHVPVRTHKRKYHVTKDLHLRDYGYSMKASPSIRQQAIDNAIKENGFQAILKHIRSLGAITNKHEIFEDYEYLKGKEEYKEYNQ